MPAFAGFDAYQYPGDETMDWLKANTNLVWCGYYLAPSPSQTKDTSWMGKQAYLAGAGWGGGRSVRPSRSSLRRTSALISRLIA